MNTVESILFKGAEPHARMIAKTPARESRRDLLLSVPFEYRAKVERQVRQIFIERRKA